MMINTSFEQEIAKIVDLLPPHTNPGVGGAVLPIRCNWGSKEKLDQFMVIPENIAKTPLIWIIKDEDDEDDEMETITRPKAKFIIANAVSDVSRFNPEIYESDYKEILNPIKNNFVTALIKSSRTYLEPKYKVYRQEDFNWKEESYQLKKEELVNIWNVITLVGDVTIYLDRCINKQIKF